MSTAEQITIVKPLSMYADGLHPNIAPAVYHEPVMGVVSKSALTEIAKSPAHYRAWIEGQTEPMESEPLAFGEAFHMALLEPARFALTYAVSPDFGDCRKTENKKKRDEWRLANAGKRPLDLDDDARIKGMILSIASHPLASKMIQDGEPELTTLWHDKESGLRCKTRTDYLVRRLRMAVDVKSAADASDGAFTRSVFKYGYHVQHALYRMGFAAHQVPVEHFVFIAVEKAPPYAVGIYDLDDLGVRAAFLKVREHMTKMRECIDAKDWPGYPARIQRLTTPQWAL